MASMVKASLKLVSSEMRYCTQISTHLTPGVQVWGNMSRLSHVLVNLLVNAAHAIGQGNPDENLITVSTRQTDTQAIIEISDTGMGISPDVISRIFDPFFTTKPFGEGMGLGLSIVNRIVIEMDGTIEVQSQPGEGSTFTLTFPSTPSLPPEAQATAQAPPQAIRILVIDDEISVSTAIKRILSVHDVVTMSDGRQALELMATQDFDVILCDLRMPNFSGIDFYKAVEHQHPMMKQRVIIITGGAVSRDSIDFLSAFNGEVLRKPFRLESLHESITNVVQ